MTSLAARIADLQRRYRAGDLDRGACDVGIGAALAASPDEGRWLTGAFDGHYAPGDDDAPPEPLGGVITDLARCAGPPTVTRAELPWLAERIDGVRLATSVTSAVPADLLDVRLRDVVVLHRDDHALRIRARVWARVVLEPEQLLPPVRPQDDDPPAERRVATDDGGLVVYGPDTRAVEGTGHGEGSGASLGCAALGCLGVPSLVAVLTAVGLVGGPRSVAVWLGALGVAWVAHARLPATRQWAGRAGCLGTLGVAGAAALAVGAVAWLVGHEPCADRPLWWLLPGLLPLVLGLGVRWRFTWLLAATAWSYSLWLWGAVPEARCASDPSLLDGHLPMVVAWGETRDRLEEATAHDPGADLLAHATEVGGDPRQSLDGALRHLDDWGCGVPVHLSAEVLFAPGEAALLADAAPHLRRLGRLLRRVEGPVSLQGHGPQAGLSGVRARAVATWLEEREGVATERLGAEGLGPARPLVQDAALDTYNRRVDVVRVCP